MLELIARVETKVDLLTGRQDALDHAHQRLAYFEQDERITQFIAPLTRKVAYLQQHLADQRKLTAKAAEVAPPQSSRLEFINWFDKSLESIQVELDNLLDAFSVESFTCPGDRLDNSRQEPVRCVESLFHDQNGLIVQRISPGYRLGDRILITERVVVHVTRQPDIPGHRS